MYERGKEENQKTLFSQCTLEEKYESGCKNSLEVIFNNEEQWGSNPAPLLLDVISLDRETSTKQRLDSCGGSVAKKLSL